jgi:hypothetical protein
MHPSTHRTLRIGAGASATVGLAFTTLLILCGVAAAHEIDIRREVGRGTPRPVAECMVLLGYSAGACEIGMFTGTSDPSWESDPTLADVAAAVRAVGVGGGRWELRQVAGTTLVCATMPGDQPACATDVRAALRLGAALR